MARPIVSDFTERIYQTLGPIVRRDEETGWVSLHVAESLGRIVDPTFQIIRDLPGRPGWSSVMDPTLAPASHLPWLAQFVGVSFDTVSVTEAQQRQRIEDREGWRRGRPAALIDAVSRTLTGAQQVTLQERYLNDAYRLRVVTFTDQTPDAAETLAAILRQKPAGLILTYDVVVSGSIDALAGTIDTLPGTIDTL